VSQRTAEQIDKIVEKLLRDLKINEPPVDLDAVRERIKVDRSYYSSSNDSTMGELLHALRIGKHNVLKVPTRLADAWKSKQLRGLWSPDKRRILVDDALHDMQKRWVETHEILHSLIPHHEEYTLGDPKQMLLPSCHEIIEAEANYGTGRMLYLGDIYRDRLLSCEPTLTSMREIAREFGNSMKSGLWKGVETLDIPACGMMSVHPWERVVEDDEKIDHFIRSVQFANQFAGWDEMDIYRKLAKVVKRRGHGPLGEDYVILTDIAGAEHIFQFECWANKYGVMSLGRYVSLKPVAVAV